MLCSRELVAWDGQRVVVLQAPQALPELRVPREFPSRSRVDGLVEVLVRMGVSGQRHSCARRHASVDGSVSATTWARRCDETPHSCGDHQPTRPTCGL